jgi:hypothetical protein
MGRESLTTGQTALTPMPRFRRRERISRNCDSSGKRLVAADFVAMANETGHRTVAWRFRFARHPAGRPLTAY